MTRRLLTGALVVLMLGTGASARQAGAPNTLTRDEAAKGWRLLFDGTSTTGWHVFGKGAVQGWEIADGALIATGKGGDIVTDENFANFELELDWKVAPRANSGIFFHVDEGVTEAVYASGPEYQLIDDDGWPTPIEAWQHTASNYAMHVATSRPTKPVGEWNHTRIVVNGSHVEHWLNGVKVVDYELWTPDWEARVKAGKWKDYPAYGRAKTGRIGLQDHGNRTWFRNIRIRVL